MKWPVLVLLAAVWVLVQVLWLYFIINGLVLVWN